MKSLYVKAIKKWEIVEGLIEDEMVCEAEEVAEKSCAFCHKVNGECSPCSINKEICNNEYTKVMPLVQKLLFEWDDLLVSEILIRVKNIISKLKEELKIKVEDQLG